MKVLAAWYSQVPVHVAVREMENSGLPLALSDILFMYWKEK